MTEKEFAEKWRDYECIEDVPEERQREFLEDAFTMYEESGFAERFKSPYESEQRFDGRKFTVVRRVTYPTDEGHENDYECDLVSGPMWVIKFRGGKEHYAYPEEICKLEREAS